MNLGDLKRLSDRELASTFVQNSGDWSMDMFDELKERFESVEKDPIETHTLSTAAGRVESMVGPSNYTFTSKAGRIYRVDSLGSVLSDKPVKPKFLTTAVTESAEKWEGLATSEWKFPEFTPPSPEELTSHARAMSYAGEKIGDSFMTAADSFGKIGKVSGETFKSVFGTDPYYAEKKPRKEVIKVSYTKQQIGEALRSDLKTLDKKLGEYDGSFELLEAKEVTVKNTDNDYLRLPLIGGEKLEGIGAYMGKRDGIIFIFETPGIDGTVEINGQAAINNLSGFADFISEALGYDFEDNMDRMIEEAKEEERTKAIREKEAFYSEDYGSW